MRSYPCQPLTYPARVRPNGARALARAVLIAAWASGPNPSARVNGCPGVVSISAVCTTFPSAAD